MLIFPAIDLKDGKVVRLHKGSFDTVHQVADDPVATARTFYEAGARYLHMVDLDGAKEGVRKNSVIVRTVADAGLKIELGGGIRSMEDIRAVFDLGVWRVVIGSAAVTDPDFVRAAIEACGTERVAVGIDAKNGSVRTAGWVEDAGLHYLDFARSMEALGVRHIIFTDIDTDGTLAGPACGRLAELKEAVSCQITASGGVSSNADRRVLRNMGLYAAIVGKAWYAGAVDLRQAVEECQ